MADMKTSIHAFCMCQSMFCAIPCPWHVWDEKARGRMLLFLPLVGLEIGALWMLLAWLSTRLGLPTPMRALLLCAWPYLSTGCMHLDGFMDVTDAVKSWRDLERRREILKDSHVGSFAVIGLALLLLAQFACFCARPEWAEGWILLLIPAVSRCCSALAVTALRPMTTSQYAGQRRPVGHLILLSLLLCALLTGAFLLCGRGTLALLAGLAGYALALLRAYRSLGGMNGDISGYALTLSELCAVAAHVLLAGSAPVG